MQQNQANTQCRREHLITNCIVQTIFYLASLNNNRGMKNLTLLFLLVSIVALSFCTTSKKAAASKNMKAATVYYDTDIAPILVGHCSPCHFAGGKMYGRLPFDMDTTIVGHEEAVLRRVKDEKENALIKQYIEQQKNNK